MVVRDIISSCSAEKGVAVCHQLLPAQAYRKRRESTTHNVCRKFNLRFQVPKESFVYPDGPMLTHPMVTIAVANMEAAGITDPLRKLTDALDKVYDDYGYRDKEGNFDFPTNVAVIATAVA